MLILVGILYPVIIRNNQHYKENVKEVVTPLIQDYMNYFLCSTDKRYRTILDDLLEMNGAMYLHFQLFKVSRGDT